MKFCPKCQTPKSVDDFHPSKQAIPGSWCRDCCRAYGKKYDQQRVATPEGAEKERVRTRLYRENNRQLLRARQRTFLAWRDSLKSDPCVDCSKNFPTWVMDWDHVRGAKVRGVGRMVSQNRVKVLAEVAKCDLVCACCHRIRTAQRTPAAFGVRAEFKVKIDGLKAKPCLDCGGMFPPEAMDFDHVRGTKIHRVSRMTTSRWELVLGEIAKCDLVCANCHRTRSQNRLRRAA